MPPATATGVARASSTRRRPTASAAQVRPGTSTRVTSAICTSTGSTSPPCMRGRRQCTKVMGRRCPSSMSAPRRSSVRRFSPSCPGSTPIPAPPVQRIYLDDGDAARAAVPAHRRGVRPRPVHATLLDPRVRGGERAAHTQPGHRCAAPCAPCHPRGVRIQRGGVRERHDPHQRALAHYARLGRPACAPVQARSDRAGAHPSVYGVRMS